MTFQYTAPRYGGMSQADLYSSRDIQFERDPSTPNQFIPLGAVPPRQNWKGNAIQWELHINGFDGGLGRVRGKLGTVIDRIRGESSGAPLETRYVDSLGLPLILRKTVSPAPSNTSASNPTVRATASNSGTDTAPIGTKPTGTAANDTLVALVIHDDPSVTISSVPTGFTLKEEIGRPQGDFRAALYTKIATSADAGGSGWTWGISSSKRWRVITAAVQNGNLGGVSLTESIYNGTARRFYLPSSGAAAISPSYDSGWEVTASASRLAAVVDRIGTAITQVGYSDSDKTNQDILFRQYVVNKPLAAQTISAQTLKIQMQAAEGGSGGNNLFLAWSVKVVTSAGALRGQVLALRRDGTEINLSTQQNRSDSATSSSVSAQAGDYLVFEVGYGGDPDAGAFDDHDGAMTVGDGAASDLPENDTETSALNPWIEFANAVSFQDTPVVETISLTTLVANTLMLTFGVVDTNSITFTGATDDGGTVTEQIDSAANSISAALYSEPITTPATVTHTVTQSGTSGLALFTLAIIPALVGTRMSYVNLFGRHAIAISDSNLIVESSALTPVLENTNYAPGSPVNGLVPLIVGGATAPQRVAVLRTNDPIQLLDDLSTAPTVNGTLMHADTEPAWGLAQTILVGTTAQPEKDIMIYANGAIRMMSRADAIGTQPTATLTSVPNGGGTVGQVWIPGQPVRILQMIPYEDCGTSQAAVRNVPLKPVFVNLFGTDAQDLDVPLVATSNVTGRSYTNAWLWQNEAILTDGQRIWEYDGQPKLMNWPGERAGLGSTGQLLCRGGWTKGHQMRILVERVALFGGTGNSLYWVEEYDERTHRFHQVSAVVDSGLVGSIVGADAIGTFPLSTISEIQYWHDDSQWSAQLVTDITRNPVYDINGVTSAGLQYGFEEEASGTSAEMVLPGLENVPSIVTEIVYVGAPELGGDDAEVEVTIADQGRNALAFPVSGGITAKFKASDAWQTYHRPFPDNTSAWDRLQYRITGRRGTDASKTPQCLPVIIRGISFLDGRVESPRKVLGAEWLGRFQ